MYVDAQNLFSDAQVVTTGSDSGVVSTNKIDLRTARDISKGQDLYVVVIIDTAMASNGSNDTLKVEVVTDDNADLSSATVVQLVGTFPAVSAAGTRLVAKLNKDESSYERYIGLLYTAAAEALSAGAFTAFLTTDAESFTAYPDGITIS